MFTDTWVDIDSNMYILSAWVKANSSESEDAVFDFVVKVETNDYLDYSEFARIHLDKKYDGWQYVAVPMKITNTFVSDKPFEGEYILSTNKNRTIGLEIEYSFNTGECYVSDPKVIALNGDIYNFERFQKEYVEGSYWTIGMSKNNGFYSVINETYDEPLFDYNVKTTIDKTRVQLTEINSYDRKNTRNKTETPRGSSTDIYGGETQTSYGYYSEKENQSYYTPKVGSSIHKAYTEYSRSLTDYLPHSITDTNGNTLTYTYDDNSKRIKSIKDGKNNNTTYIYDSNGKPLRISNGYSYNNYSYQKGYLTELYDGEKAINIEYDGFGREKCVRVNGIKYTSLGYTDRSDGSTIIYDYIEDTRTYIDPLGNPYKKYRGSIIESEIKYNMYGQVTEFFDNKAGYKYKYEYDQYGNVIKIYRTATSNEEYSAADLYISYTYDSNDPKRLLSTSYGNGSSIGATFNKEFEYKKVTGKYRGNNDELIDMETVSPENKLESVIIDQRFTDTVIRDDFGRITSRCLVDDIDTTITDSTYRYNNKTINGKSLSTCEVGGISGDYSTTYAYDANGNITRYTGTNGEIVTYEYDSLNRIIRENNSGLGLSYVYAYTATGNIFSKTTYPYTTESINNATPIDKKEEYVYNYYAGRDQLTEIVTTDANGNRTVEYNLYNKLGTPYSYRGRFMNWEGNKLTSCGEKTYSYDASGRFANFKYEGDKLINDGRRYMYGVDGVLGFFISGRKYYFYQKNLFGDVVGIKEYDFTTATTTNVAAYVYDAFGNHKVYAVTVDYNGNEHLTENTDPNFIGNYNPIRYRGYYYDIDTGYYFVGGRCYDPEIGRFIDPAGISSINPTPINGFNLYAYAISNPVCIAYSNPNSGGNSNGGMVSSLRTAPSYSSLGNSANVLGALSIFANIFGTFDQWSGYLSSGLEAGLRYWGPKGFGISSLGKYSKVLTKFGIGMTVAGAVLSFGSSVYSNFSNTNYTTSEAIGASVMDAVYYTGKGFGTYYASAGVGKLAVAAGIAAGTAVLGTTIGLLGALVIGGLVAVGVGIAGAIAIYYLGDAVDYIYEKFKEWIFE